MTKKRSLTISKIDRESMAHLSDTINAIGAASRLMRTALRAGDDEATGFDLIDVSEVVVAAKLELRKAINALDGAEIAGDIRYVLFDLWDATIVLLAVMKLPTPPDGDDLSICPIAGTMRMIIDALEKNEAKLAAIAKKQSIAAAA